MERTNNHDIPLPSCKNSASFTQLKCLSAQRITDNQLKYERRK